MSQREDRLRKLLTDHQDEINRGDFKEIYSSEGWRVLGDFTRLCLRMGLTPGKMFPNKIIPQRFYNIDSKDLKRIDLTGIQTLAGGAFDQSGIEEYIGTSEIRTVYNGAFKQSKVRSIKLENVEEMTSEAFSHCTSLETFPLIETTPLTEISIQCFSSCVSLKEIIIPNTVKKIAIRAFSYCLELDNVSIPGALEECDASPFVGDIIKRLEIRGTKEDWERIKRDCPDLLHGAEVKQIVCTK